MSTFPLRIGTPDGLLYEGEVVRLVCRTINGDLAILPRHCNYCTALGMGEAHIVLEDGSRKNAACIGGMLSVMNGTCRFLQRPGSGKRILMQSVHRMTKKRAEEMIAKGGLTDQEYKMVSAKLQRALVRLSVKE